MLIEIYRNEVGRLYAALLDTNDPPEREELDKCVRGDLRDFRSNYYTDDFDDEIYEDGWWSDEHRDFYDACERLKVAEHREYHLAMLTA